MMGEVTSGRIPRPNRPGRDVSWNGLSVLLNAAVHLVR